ncbi:hypothetical protein GCM10022222_31810 [Amycolatopsis ultiminotia]|uniref:SDR family oxidoreductase n=1 Tax=Amycolatopsis ultiminotia TaxID=543629 RepID=A0ABP6W951_9PSEU
MRLGAANVRRRLFLGALDRFGKIDVAVANAGVEIIDAPIPAATEEQFDRLFGINTKGTFFTLLEAAEHVADNGRIIHVGSSSTCGPYPGVGLYGSSKMACRYAVQVLALEVGAHGITVNTILPTVIEGAGVFTDIADDDPLKVSNQARPLGGRMDKPEDVADAAEYFANDLSSWVSGQHLLISGDDPPPGRSEYRHGAPTAPSRQYRRETATAATAFFEEVRPDCEKPGVGRSAVAGQAPAPPSTGTIAPVTIEARSLSSHAAASATSRGSAIRPIGVAALFASITPGVSLSHSSIISVAVPPGVMPFTRIPSGAQLTAADSVMLFNARFMAP